ncbi:terminase large subunit domain-containing protein [Paremcibacter congregatus]|uniref:terminase large subunit domain-containing protein n=1 Tax=Paremcibacter congregatus TaxID=2043170 RepID=UPI0030EC4AC6|tara:strand:+ start:766 stop:2151 length:1386 start_codon:yes stop_codon:yes gene_type:complete
MERPNSILKLHPYQKKWFDDRSRFKIGMFSRQSGKTFTSCLEIVDDCFEHEVLGQRTKWVILSRGERQAKEAMDEAIKPFCKAYFQLFKAILKIEPEFREFEYEVEGEKYKALEVIFPNGSRILALPANPDTARGFSANVFLDEFAFHRDSREIWKALFPVISAGYKIRVVSTPNGKGNKFYELVTGQSERWSRHVVDIHEAVKQGLDRDIPELKEALDDEDTWSQEFELKWLDESSAWLSYDLISSVEHPDAGNPDLYAGGRCIIGNDIGLRNDLWVAWVLEEVGDVFWTREIRTLKRKAFSVQDQVMDELMKKYRVSRLLMDQTGMGEKPVEDAIDNFGSHVVEGVLFSAATKLNMAVASKKAFQDRKIRIPEGDSALRADLHKLKKETGPTGNPRLIADRDSTGHADRTWACFLAISGGLVGGHEYGYESIRDIDNGADDEYTGDFVSGSVGSIRGAY